MIHPSHRAAGFTLIELVAAMAASTLLLVALASTIVMSSQLLEAPPEDTQKWHDRDIADRLVADLRYATSVDESYGDGFSIAKPNPISGSSENAVYEAYMDGFTRQVDSGTVFNLDADPPNHQSIVDGYTAPTYVASSNVARVHSSNSAATNGLASTLVVDLPSGCIDGDLLLLAVAARSPWFTQVAPNNWNLVAFRSVGGMELSVMYQIYSAATALPVTVTSLPNAAIAASVVCVKNIDSSNPIRWSGTDSGVAFATLANTHPAPLETTGYEDNQLNVQVFSAFDQPWHTGSLGLSAFTDVSQVTAAAALSTNVTSLAIAVRNGATPDLSTRPRVWHQADGSWGQIAVQIGAAP